MVNRLRAAVSVFPTPGVWAALWCVAAAAIYLCVPETDQMTMVGVLTAIVLVFEVVWRRRQPMLIHLAVVVIVLWSGLYGATGRHSAIVGTLFAFWPALIVPLLVLVFPVLAQRPEPVRWAIAACGAAASLIVSRTGALQPTIEPALRAAAVWGVASLLAAAVIVAATGPRRSA